MGVQKCLYRGRGYPDLRYGTFGFRLARSQ